MSNEETRNERNPRPEQSDEQANEQTDETSPELSHVLVIDEVPEISDAPYPQEEHLEEAPKISDDKSPEETREPSPDTRTEAPTEKEVEVKRSDDELFNTLYDQLKGKLDTRDTHFFDNQDIHVKTPTELPTLSEAPHVSNDETKRIEHKKSDDELFNTLHDELHRDVIHAPDSEKIHKESREQLPTFPAAADIPTGEEAEHEESDRKSIDELDKEDIPSPDKEEAHVHEELPTSFETPDVSSSKQVPITEPKKSHKIYEEEQFDTLYDKLKGKLDTDDIQTRDEEEMHIESRQEIPSEESEETSHEIVDDVAKTTSYKELCTKLGEKNIDGTVSGKDKKRSLKIFLDETQREVSEIPLAETGDPIEDDYHRLVTYDKFQNIIQKESFEEDDLSVEDLAGVFQERIRKGLKEQFDETDKKFDEYSQPVAREEPGEGEAHQKEMYDLLEDKADGTLHVTLDVVPEEVPFEQTEEKLEPELVVDDKFAKDEREDDEDDGIDHELLQTVHHEEDSKMFSEKRSEERRKTPAVEDVEKSKGYSEFGRRKLTTCAPLFNNILHLPMDPTWYMVVNLLCVGTAYYHIYNAAAGGCLKRLVVWKDTLLAVELLYLLDVVLMLISKYGNNMSFQQANIFNRPMWIVIIEIISLAPIEYLSAYRNYRERVVYCVLKLNRCIRIVKVGYFFRRYHKCVNESIYMRMLEMSMHAMTIGLTAFMVYCNMSCYKKDCEDYCNFSVMWMLFTKVTISGMSNYPEIEWSWQIITVMTMLLSFFFVMLLTMCCLIIDDIENICDRHRFKEYIANEMTRLKDFHLPAYITQEVRSTSRLTWEKCGGFNENQSFLRFNPPVMNTEVLLNISWSVFSHSSLFRGEPLKYLRYLTPMVRQCFYMPGEFVFKKNEIKSKMVYVVSGTIQLLSEDDGESPILSFCNGTCIGESTLIFRYKSKNHVCCKTFCELHIIEERDFIKASVYYPELYRHCKQVILKRYRTSLKQQQLSKYAKTISSLSTRTKDTYTILWLKNTLHKLMSIDKEASARHEMQNIYLQHAIDTSIYHKLLFCADYLDLLAIQERHEAQKDTVFVKTSFPCILQPTSILVYLNNTCITISTIIISFMLPYMCFTYREIGDHSYTIIAIVTFQNLLDIYVQLSTGINTRHGMISKVTSIAALKLRDVGFWCDIISCIPVEVFSAVFVTNMNRQNNAKLRLNRLTKLYRVYTFFQKWEQKLNVNTLLIRYVKFVWIHLYSIYFVSCIIMGQHPEKTTGAVAFRAVQFVTTVGLLDNDLYEEPALYLGLDLLFFTIKLIMYSQIASAFVMMNYRSMKMKITCTDIVSKLKVHKISEKYNQRAAKFLSTQNLYKIFIQSRHEYFYTAEMNKYLQEDIREFLLSDLLSSHVFFQLLPNDCIKDVCTIMVPLTLPFNEVIIYAGDMSSKVYIVWCGKYTTYDANGQHIRVVRGDRVVNLVPAIFNSSAALSYVTVTDCRLIYFDIKELKQVLTKYPKYLNIFDSTLANCEDISNDLKRYAKQEAITDLTPLLKIREKSFYFFGFNQKVDSFEEFDYYLPFDHLYPFSFIRFVLLRVTIMPNGLFIRIWESFRCLFAVLTCLLVFAKPLNSMALEVAIAFLYVTAFADIYVRLHVCYYNEEGLLVKHPQKTALHYLTHGFLVDILGALPFRYVVSEDANANQTNLITNGNCLIQLHRYVQFFMVLTDHSISVPTKGFTVIYLPILLIAVNCLSSFFTNLQCIMHPDVPATVNYTKGIYCWNDSVLSVSPFAKPIDPWRAHLYGVYIFASIITTTGWQGYRTQEHTAEITITICSFLGLYVTVLFISYVLKFHIVRYGSMLEYQDQMRFLKKFMKRIKVSRKLRNYAIRNCEKYWSYCQGPLLSDVIRPLFDTLKLDILYDCYGVKAYRTSIFQHKNKNFYRNMLNYGTTRFVLKDEYIYSVNDLMRSAVIVLDGVIDVIGSDGLQITTLYPGSLFGNLEGRTYRRCGQSYIAVTHTELFTIPSLQFYKLFKFYPEMEDDFYTLKSTNVSYINSKIGVFKYATVENKPKAESNSIFEHIFNPHSNSIQLFEVIILIIPCYLGLLIDFYQVGAGDTSAYVLVCQYICDILYATHFLLKNRIAYEDDKGVLITDKHKIRKKNSKQRMTNALSLISLVPLEVIFLVLPTEVTTVHYTFFRINRVLRIIWVVNKYDQLKRRLNVNMVVVKTFSIILWVALYIAGAAALMSIISCSTAMNMHPETPACTILFKSDSMNKTALYTRWIYISTNSLTLCSQDVFYPQHWLIILLFILVMLVGYQLYAIVIGEMFETLFGRYSRKYMYHSVIRRVKFFMRGVDLTTSLQTRVYYYMSALWLYHDGILNPKLLTHRPTYLKDAILNDVFFEEMRKHPLFGQCHPHCLRQIIQKFKFRPFFEGDYIQLEHIRDARMYILIYGKVAILTNVDKNVNERIAILEGGTHFFGVLAGFYPRRAHLYTYRSTVINTYVAFLEREDWIHILNFFPASKQLVHEAARNYVGY